MVVIITGPTASGKTALSEQLVPPLQGAIINADMGQFYTALTVGTAKPPWQTLPFDSYLFDWIDTPRDCSVVAFKEAVDQCVASVEACHATPIIVGGSSFYIKSLFYPPHDIGCAQSIDTTPLEALSAVELWEQLNIIDPVRARDINKTDHYRLVRALALWHGTGKKPSTLKPQFVMPYKKILLVIVLPERSVVRERIAHRTGQMINNDGWVDEVRGLIGTEWQSFVKTKKLVGYTELIDWLAAGADSTTLADVITTISIKTRQYAKRQENFLKKLAQDLVSDASDMFAELEVLIVPNNSLQVVNQIIDIVKKS